MLVLVNTNRIQPPVAPVGLEYLASAAMDAGIEVEILDLCFADDPEKAIEGFFEDRSPLVVGLSFRNNDDSYWPYANWFAPQLADIVRMIRKVTDARIVLGGIGYSIFAEPLLAYTEADLGIRGDGEQAIVGLYRCIQGNGRLEDIPGLVYRRSGRLVANPPSWPKTISIRSSRDIVDNIRYFREGGQVGFETKRGCCRTCSYCADRIAKGPCLRLRPPMDVADEVQGLIDRGIDVLHTCDSEFNASYEHALAVCQEFINRGLGSRLRWYAYASIVPFDQELAILMRKAGCVGIDFTADSADPGMLGVYGHDYGPQAIESAIRLCKDNGIAVMVDLLFGGPGETVQTLTRTIEFFKHLPADGIGAALGVRLYPGTALTQILSSDHPLDQDPGIRRSYDGPVDLLRPTFYICPGLGHDPAGPIQGLVGEDRRFFVPSDQGSGDHNYDTNADLIEAIKAGHKGAYWHILLRLRGFD